MVFHFAERQVFIHVLAHHEGWLNIERDLCDYPQRTKPNNGSQKRFSVLLAGKLNLFAGRRDDFNC